MFDVAMITMLAICIVTDVRSRKIYNAVLLPIVGFALIGSGIIAGWSGLGSSLAGLGAGIGLLIIPYLMGGIGAGDVKLLGVIGALKGTVFVFYAALYMALLGAVVALGIIVFRHGTFDILRWNAYRLAGWRSGVALPAASIVISSHTYPYGVAIAGGALLCLVFKGGLPI